MSLHSAQQQDKGSSLTQEKILSDSHVVENGPGPSDGELVVDWDAKEEAAVRHK